MQAYPEYGTRNIHIVGIVHMNMRVRNAGSFVVRDHLVLRNELDTFPARLPR